MKENEYEALLTQVRDIFLASSARRGYAMSLISAINEVTDDYVLRKQLRDLIRGPAMRYHGPNWRLEALDEAIRDCCK